MKVKRFVVTALPEALPMIRGELGADAVILNTKEIRVGGFLGMFGKRKMEVIAAVETGPAAKPQAIHPQAAPRASAAAGAAAGTGSAAGAALAIAAHAAAVRQPEQVRAGEKREHPLSGVAAVPAGETPPPSGPKTAPEEELLSEIRDMKLWIRQLSRQRLAETRPKAVQALAERLSGQDVAEDWIDKLLAAVTEQVNEDDPDGDTVWRAAGRTLHEWLSGTQGEGIRPDTRIVHFVGPTGVGKTTTIAKLAAEQTLKAGRRVGLITSDTYRIAAVDQLRTYATILNVPLEVVFSPSEVARAYKQLSDRELIFMDTAGRNYRNELFVSEVNSLLQSGVAAETFLVLSLTGKYADMATVAGHFAKYGVRRVVFTKQDETSAVGAVLNLALEFGFRTEYIACGQTVPDDIAPFRADAYIRQLLGGVPS
ncbi:flagellar biosynthesis protein FlhF [Paenibacillus humicola]|uniref:flagellar biosynthesis protein FlhF n=1 Tax=Paenibacillus humicola TaxID=3110540 RepID=UPI00237A4255|nr:flagellar biosynthesis protein FlhF [Paenibacillus humicola]